jgi:hypothetical protein
MYIRLDTNTVNKAKTNLPSVVLGITLGSVIIKKVNRVIGMLIMCSNSDPLKSPACEKANMEAP